MVDKAGLQTAWRLARRADVVKRALLTGMFVGGILTIINQGDAILSGSLTAGGLVKIALTACVPYCVSTYSSVAAMLQYGER